MAKQKEKVTFRDVPQLLASLDCGDAGEKVHALKLLCPCRNRRYDREVWLAILRAYEAADGIAVRDQAQHAIETLRERARTDPRTQELVSWLAEQGIETLKLEESIPVWRPNLRGNGLYIPRFEPSPRSKVNRRR